MNIFVLDENIKLCAQYHNNKHVVKMILESTQLLNNALAKSDKDYIPVYKPTHVNHPPSLWTSTSFDNFMWLMNLALELCNEYSFRYNKTHKCEKILHTLRDSPSVNKLPKVGRTKFIRYMPDIYKTPDVVESYRNYYRGAKRDIAVWKNRPTPQWWF